MSVYHILTRKNSTFKFPGFRDNSDHPNRVGIQILHALSDYAGRKSDRVSKSQCVIQMFISQFLTHHDINHMKQPQQMIRNSLYTFSRCNPNTRDALVTPTKSTRVFVGQQVAHRHVSAGFLSIMHGFFEHKLAILLALLTCKPLLSAHTSAWNLRSRAYMCHSWCR